MRPLFLLLALSASCLAQGAFHYRVTLDPEREEGLSVVVEVPADAPAELVLSLPEWYPGAWRREGHFADVLNLRATAGDGNPVPVDHSSPARWVVRRKQPGALRIAYQLAPPPTAANPRHYVLARSALLEGARTFLHVRGEEKRPCEVTVSAPRGWQVASPLTEVPESGRRRAPGYEALIDAPLLVGELETWRFDHDGIVHDVTVDRGGATGPVGKSELLRSLKQLAAAYARAFGGFPYARYHFFLVEGAKGSSGRGDSAVVGVPAGSFGLHQVDILLDASRAMLRAYCPHRFRPAELVPVALEKPFSCRSLWLVDGLMEYYGRLMLVRAGIADGDAWRRLLAIRILEHRNHLLSELVSPEDSSLQAWNGREGIDHALQGELLCCLLDILIRDGSDGERSLDDLVRSGLELYGQKTGFEAADVVGLASKLAGQDLATFFAYHVRSAQSLPWDATLPRIALAFDWVRWTVKDPELRTVREGDHLIILAPPADSPLAVAGLRSKDVVISVNQRSVATPEDVDRQIARLGPGKKLRIDVRRGDKLRSYRLSLVSTAALKIPANMKDGRVTIRRVDPGPLRRAGIEPGDILEKIDNRRITDLQDIPPCLDRIRGGKTLLTISRAGKRRKIPVKAPDLETWRGAINPHPKATPKARRLLADLLK